eukprot:403365316
MSKHRQQYYQQQLELITNINNSNGLMFKGKENLNSKNEQILKKQSKKENEYYHLPEVGIGSIVNPQFKKSFFGRFSKDKKERLNSMVKMYQNPTGKDKVNKNQMRDDSSSSKMESSNNNSNQKLMNIQDSSQFKGSSNKNPQTNLDLNVSSIRHKEKSNEKLMKTPIQNGKQYRNESVGKHQQISDQPQLYNQIGGKYTTFKQQNSHDRQRDFTQGKTKKLFDQSQAKSDHVEYKKYLQNISIQNILNISESGGVSQNSPQQQVEIGQNQQKRVGLKGAISGKQQQLSQKVTLNEGADLSIMIGKNSNPSSHYYHGLSAARVKLRNQDFDDDQNSQYINEFTYTTKKPREDQDDQRDYSQINQSYSRDHENSQNLNHKNYPQTSSYTHLPNIGKEHFNKSIKLKNTDNIKKMSLASQVNMGNQPSGQQQQQTSQTDFNFTFNPKPLVSSYKQAQLREVLKDKTQLIMNQIQKNQQQQLHKQLDMIEEKENLNNNKQVMKKSELIQLAKQVINKPFYDPKLEQIRAQKRNTYDLQSNSNKENVALDVSKNDLLELKHQSQINQIHFPESVRSKLQSELSSPVKYRRRGIKSSPRLPKAFREKVTMNYDLQQQNMYHNTNPYNHNISYNLNDRSFDSQYTLQLQDKIDQSIIYRSNNQSPLIPNESSTQINDDVLPDSYLSQQNILSNLNEMLQVKLFQTPSQNDKIQISSQQLLNGISSGVNSQSTIHNSAVNQRQQRNQQDLIGKSGQVQRTSQFNANGNSYSQQNTEHHLIEKDYKRAKFDRISIDHIDRELKSHNVTDLLETVVQKRHVQSHQIQSVQAGQKLSKPNQSVQPITNNKLGQFQQLPSDTSLIEDPDLYQSQSQEYSLIQ